MEVTRNILRRRIVRRPRYQRDDLRIEIRDDSSDDEDSPSPTNSSFPPGVSKTHSPKTKTESPTLPPQPPPPVLNPANPTDVETTTTATSSSSTQSLEPTFTPSQPLREQPRPTALPPVLSTTESSSSTTSFSTPTALPNSRFTTTLAPMPTGGTTKGGSEAGLGNDRSSDVGWTPTAIAFGTIAIAALFLCIGWGLWWFIRYRKRRQARQMYDRSMSPGSAIWNPASTFSPPTMPSRRAPSSIMAELMGAAYAAENGNAGYGPDRNSLTPQGYLDEKTYDPSRQLPILEPAPVHQPNVRNSIASWIRRHHPLKLNPLSGRSSVYSTRTIGASAQDVNAPPVPAVPDTYRSPSQQAGDAAPQTTNRQAVSSRYGTENQSEYGTNSILSLYESAQREQQQQQQQQQQKQPGQQPPEPLWLQTPSPLMHGDRGVSMAPTEASARTESTWRSWGAGVTQPREHAPPPQTPRRGWIEKCIKFGGLK
ncbi:uncharacterized protein CTRU02_203312 [Colletotrichum truncatum]|uniref:Uncharacterized protein n=1 Tax=Colletotrichum truncatum TaxID=5467 RepID=A0ACC3Z904_COLTU|nr:uncharacterized protein CTRU02_15672 [Colletotrichum truncatum]KAF6780798.1 hypothetical protein CTRU02_15672 [Colletotrichum truncatum]